jgi:uncharacterized protein YebE (UPF0316 family)
MVWTTIGNALLIFALRITDVSMGTVRTTMIMRGQRKWAALIGFVEVTIWVLAISRVIANLDTIWNVVGYSGGFATGTLLGMWIEDKLALGFADVNIVSMNKGLEIAAKIRQRGYGATQMQAEGKSGPVHFVQVIAPRKQVREVIRLVNEVDATAFVTVQDARQVMRGYGRLAK